MTTSHDGITSDDGTAVDPRPVEPVPEPSNPGRPVQGPPVGSGGDTEIGESELGDVAGGLRMRIPPSALRRALSSGGTAGPGSPADLEG